MALLTLISLHQFRSHDRRKPENLSFKRLLANNVRGPISQSSDAFKSFSYSFSFHICMKTAHFTSNSIVYDEKGPRKTNLL